MHVVLLVCTLFLICGIVARDHCTESAPWLRWLTINIGLAWVPVALSGVAHSDRLVAVLVLPLWLLFLPNAPYLVTDLVHLRGREVIPWADMAILVAVAALGLGLGVVSTHQMASAMGRDWGLTAGSGVYVVASIAIGFGVYVGRFLRWNSWDAFTNPRAVVLSVLGLAQDPRAWVCTALCGLAFFLAAQGSQPGQ